MLGVFRVQGLRFQCGSAVLQPSAGNRGAAERSTSVMMLCQRNLNVIGFLNGCRYLLMDRDVKFFRGFRAILEPDGFTCLRLPKRSPNLNGQLERFMRSVKEERLGRLILFGERSLRNAVRDFLEHYHNERNHQGLENRLLAPDVDVGRAAGD